MIMAMEGENNMKKSTMEIIGVVAVLVVLVLALIGSYNGIEKRKCGHRVK